MVEEKTSAPLSVKVIFGMALLFVIDRILKFVASAQWETQSRVFLWTPFLNSSFFYFWESHKTASLAVLLCFALAVIFMGAHVPTRRHRIALCALAAGGASNLADHVIYGGVIDYLYIGGGVVVNLADILIVAGVLSLMIMRYEDNKKISAND